MQVGSVVCLALLALVAVENVSAEYIRGCYFTNWAQYRPGKGKYEPEQYINGLCTHILFAFGWMKEDFTVKAHDAADLPSSWKPKGMYQRVNDLKLQDPKLKTLLSIGGWTFGTRLFTAMAKSATGRKVFIDSAMKFVTKHGFDGLDIDWEYPKGAKAEYITFITEARKAFDAHQPRLLLTAAVGAAPATVDAAYDVAAMAPQFDFVMLMSYDFHGSWEQGTGLNSPLHGGPHDKPGQEAWNTAGSAAYWHKLGMPKGKLVIGIGAYGRGWTLADTSKNGIGAPTAGASKATQFVREAGMSSYYELCAMENSGATKMWAPSYEAPYLYQGNQWFGYDDPKSVKGKMDWLKSEGYAGAFVWTLDLDDFNGDCGHGKYPLINTIKKELSGSTGGPTTLQPTTASKSSPSPSSSKLPPTSAPPSPSTKGTTKPPTPPSSSSVKPSPTTQKTTTKGGSKCAGNVRYYRDPNDCSVFYQCAHGRPYQHKCPPGLHFNADKSYCDWPRNVKC